MHLLMVLEQFQQYFVMKYVNYFNKYFIFQLYLIDQRILEMSL